MTCEVSLHHLASTKEKLALIPKKMHDEMMKNLMRGYYFHKIYLDEMKETEDDREKVILT